MKSFCIAVFLLLLLNGVMGQDVDSFQLVIRDTILTKKKKQDAIKVQIELKRISGNTDAYFCKFNEYLLPLDVGYPNFGIIERNFDTGLGYYVEDDQGNIITRKPSSFIGLEKK